MERLTGDSSETDDPELPPAIKSTDPAIPQHGRSKKDPHGPSSGENPGCPPNERGAKDGPRFKLQCGVTKKTGAQLIR